MNEVGRGRDATRPAVEPARGVDAAGIIGALREGIMLRSVEGRVLEANDAFLALVGLARDEVIGVEGPPYPWHAEPEEAAVVFRRIQELDAGLKEVLFRRPDGETFPVQVTGSALRDADGEIVAYLAACRDVGPLRRAEEEAARLDQARRDALAQLAAEREAREMKDEFLAMVSHEIRTPLTSVLGYQELALADTSEDGVRGLLEVASRNGRHLARLVDDFLLIGRANVGRLEMHRRPESLGELVQQAVEGARVAAEDAGVVLEADVVPGVVAEVDAARVSQVLGNLVGNAIAFSPVGGRVRVALVATGDRATVTVSDEGPGIPAHEQSRIFDPFYRSGSPGEETEGSGLGLAVSRAIVEAHGGELTVSSAPGRGAEFAAWWPLRGDLSGSGGAPRSS